MAQRKEEFYDYDSLYNYEEQEYYYEEELNAYYGVADENESNDTFEDDSTYEEAQPQAPIYAAPRPFKSRFQDISRLEKILAMTIIFVAICFAVSTIFVRSKITGTMGDINSVERDNQELTTNINDLRQQVNELSRRSRIEDIARQYGLTVSGDVRSATRNR